MAAGATPGPIRSHNRAAWSRMVEGGNVWTRPVSGEQVARARRGDWQLVLTPNKPVPADWYPPIAGASVLCLASAGGQQGPIFAAAGAKVTVFDNCPAQLAQDRQVAQRDGLEMELIEGDMADLSALDDGRFDLVFHPVSNCFVPDVKPVWAEASRVLKPGGRLLAGFNNPAIYLFDDAAYDQGRLEVANPLPYSDAESLSQEQIAEFAAQGRPLEFSHSLTDQIGGQLAAGLVLIGLYEDTCLPEDDDPVSKYMPFFLATCAIKPPHGCPGA
ncbi:MAG: class I SAM-dependent methyltransferase [Phycisphaerae bacterium]